MAAEEVLTAQGDAQSMTVRRLVLSRAERVRALCDNCDSDYVVLFTSRGGAWFPRHASAEMIIRAGAEGLRFRIVAPDGATVEAGMLLDPQGNASRMPLGYAIRALDAPKGSTVEYWDDETGGYVPARVTRRCLKCSADLTDAVGLCIFTHVKGELNFRAQPNRYVLCISCGDNGRNTLRPEEFERLCEKYDRKFPS